MNEPILALDLGTTSGWAARSVDGSIAHGFASFKFGKKEGAGMRYLKFQRWLAALPFEPSHVYYEGVVRHLGTQAAHVYGGLEAILTAWCESRQIPYTAVPVGTIKLHATGKGNSDKAAMIASARARGHPVVDDNEADAIAILYYSISLHD